MQLPVVGKVLQSLAGISKRRTMPSFAPETFTHWFRRRPLRNQGRPKIILWPDTFNNHLHPQTAIAAVEVLEAAGFRVTIPDRPLCCGRPLYDFGMLVQASASGGKSSMRSGLISRPAFRSSVSSRAAWQPFATS